MMSVPMSGIVKITDNIMVKYKERQLELKPIRRHRIRLAPTTAQ